MHNQYKKISVNPQPNTIPYSDENGHLSDWLEADPVIQALKLQTEFIGTVLTAPEPDTQAILTQFVVDTVGRQPRNGDEVAIEDVGELWLFNGTQWVYFTNTTLKDATKNSKGVVQIGEGIAVNNGVISADVGLKITNSPSVIVNNAYTDNLVALFHMENTAAFDTITPVSNTGSFNSSIAKFGSYSYQIDANTDHLIYKFDGIFNKQFTIDFWAYVGSLNFHTPAIGIYLYGNENDYAHMQLGMTLNNGRLMLYDKDGYLGSSATSFTAETWAHIAITYDPITRIATPYVNGVKGTGVVYTRGLFAPTYYLDFSGVSNHTVCIDELRISDGIKYTADFNVPTAAYNYTKLKDHKLVALVNTPDPVIIADNLSTADATKALSANQGKVLNEVLNTKEDRVVAGNGITITRKPAIEMVENDTLQLWPLQNNSLVSSVTGGSNFPVSTFESVAAGNMVYLTQSTTSSMYSSAVLGDYTVEGMIAVPSGTDATIEITSQTYMRFDGIDGRIYFSNGDMTRIEYQSPSASLKAFAITRDGNELHFFYDGILLDTMYDYDGTIYSLGNVDITANKLGAAYLKISNTCKYRNNYNPDAGLTVISGSSSPTYNFYTNQTGNTLTIVDTTVANLVLIYKNGVLLQPTADYTISGTTLTLVSALSATDKIAVGVY